MSILILLLTAFIWGVAFVAQSVGMDYIGPFYFNAIRYLIGSIVLIPVIVVLKKSRQGKEADNAAVTSEEEYRKNTIIGGICCGLCLSVASLFQQFGIIGTTVGKAGFVTALYIIIVPLLGLFVHKKVGLNVWISAVLAICGFYLMCISETLSLNIYDFYVLVGAFIFSLHILVIDYFAPKANPVAMSAVQFMVSGIICGAGGLVFEQISMQAIMDCAIPLLYAGVLSCGVAYTLQIVGQRNMNPAVASLLLSLESVFSALAGWVILGQVMSRIEITGCILVFAGVILAQIPIKKSGLA